MILMNHFKLYRIIGILLAVSCITWGCTTRVADLTIVSTKNLDLADAKSLDAKKGQRFKGEDCVFIFIIPWGVPNLEKAVDQALQKGNGNVMVDQVSYSKFFSLGLIGQHCLEVEGAVLKIAEK